MQQTAPPRRIRRFTVLSAAILGASLSMTGAAAAQPAVKLTFGRAFDSIGLDGQVYTGQAMAATLNAEYAVADGRVRLIYALDAATFASTGDWHYDSHTAGATFKIPFDAHHAVFLGAAGSWRDNGTSWLSSDFGGVRLFANAELHPGPATVRFGYRFDRRRFPDLRALDQNEHDGFAGVHLTLATRTTVIGEAHAGAKSYGSSTGPTASARQVAATARIAQSLGDRTGAAIQVSARSTAGRLPAAVLTMPVLFFDDGIYDDTFASNRWTLQADLKHLLSNGMILEGGCWTARKMYTQSPALDLDGYTLPGDPLRSDRVWRAGGSWTLPVLDGQLPRLALDLHVEYFFTRHGSNDFLYNYSSHSLEIGATVSY